MPGRDEDGPALELVPALAMFLVKLDPNLDDDEDEGMLVGLRWVVPAAFIALPVLIGLESSAYTRGLLFDSSAPGLLITAYPHGGRESRFSQGDPTTLADDEQLSAGRQRNPESGSSQ